MFGKSSMLHKVSRIYVHTHIWGKKGNAEESEFSTEDSIFSAL